MMCTLTYNIFNLIPLPFHTFFIRILPPLIHSQHLPFSPNLPHPCTVPHILLFFNSLNPKPPWLKFTHFHLLISLHTPHPQFLPTFSLHIHLSLPTSTVKTSRRPPHNLLFKHLLHPHILPLTSRYTSPTSSQFLCSHTLFNTHLFFFAAVQHCSLSLPFLLIMAPCTSPATSADASTCRLRSATNRKKKMTLSLDSLQFQTQHSLLATLTSPTNPAAHAITSPAMDQPMFSHPKRKLLLQSDEDSTGSESANSKVGSSNQKFTTPTTSRPTIVPPMLADNPSSSHLPSLP
jgi:hypothetical protein